MKIENRKSHFRQPTPSDCMSEVRQPLTIKQIIKTTILEPCTAYPYSIKSQNPTVAQSYFPTDILGFLPISGQTTNG
jgi:hypothetical protein